MSDFLTTQQLAAQLGIQAKTILVMRSVAKGSYRRVTPVKVKNRLQWPLDTVAQIKAKEAEYWAKQGRA